MAVEIEQFMCRDDNFGVLAHDRGGGETAIIDAPQEAPIVAAIERTGWTPSVLFITHHHGDHTEASEALKRRFGLKIIGPKAEADKIAGLDEAVEDGDVVHFGGEPVHIIATPGHTAGQVNYHFPQSGVVFTGDTLFSLGCGRVFETPYEVMFDSLKKLAALPSPTRIYCGHEYTQANARFALSVDPDNPALKERAAEVEKLRAAGKPTLPTTIERELAANPFLRWHDPAIRRNLGMQNAADADVFVELRKRKDNFRG